MRLAKIMIVSVLICLSNAVFADVFVKNINCNNPVVSYRLSTPAIKQLPGIIEPPVVSTPTNTANHLAPPTTPVTQEVYQPLNNYTVSVMIGKGVPLFLPVKVFYLLNGGIKQYCSGSGYVELIKTPDGSCECE
ncbi:MAG: hypothetical protein COY58_04605 [Gammaproteobacteria bacterium CG_4_10_14_0_8_um_filter_38_16]|nr:MAG: hypothetical protein COY58_04605 [Gammaproteobacteria bacterium CG_4_10_14_0_8_um_filter_38_16]PJA03990.1 MAG: hypothetical protein COX72_02345 [Gammaproteobacteria bacterium CG_4_10_14_0_2_um_filter_38_22]PJB11178.1 MAG: hypothetical protein CO120_01020 [Gammaproteobacteria bacterium CG_4_9_14_3_um_filter_38_9]